MSVSVHMELDALCLLLLCTIVYQSRKNVNQQMNRMLFRMSAYGIIIQLILDILWLLVEGRVAAGAIFANRVINALYLGGGVCLGCIWYLYVLETLGYKITRRLQTIVMLPGLAFTALNIMSIWTEWFFIVSPENIYSHGPMFWLQSIGAYGMLIISLVHILLRLISGRGSQVANRDIRKLFIFYGVTVLGSVVSLFSTGMPGTWPCAAISIVLIYMDDQNREVLSGMITAMAADYRSIYYADLDVDECICVRDASGSNEPTGESRKYAFSEMLAEYAQTYVDPSYRSAFLDFVDPDNIRGGLAGETMLSHRYLTVRDGTPQYELLRIAGVRTIEERADHIVHAIGVGFSDVDQETRSELEQKHALEEALARAEEASAAKTAFLSSMSHEIRTPMNAIIGMNNIALHDPSISQVTRDELEKIGSSAQHLLSLINDILDMSRIESGRMELKSEVFSFREMIDQINTIVDGQCEDKRLTYDSRIIGTADEYFTGDALRLKQVIINILGNAVKFTDSPGTITFTVEQRALQTDGAACPEDSGNTEISSVTEHLGSPGDSAIAGSRMLHFTIADTGIGMDESFIPKLFDPFAQEDATTTNRYGGSGLGMAITKSMIDLMGGEITVESRKGHGTTFTLDIPLQRAQHIQAAESHIQDEPAVSVAGLHVLIADDLELNAEILSDLLELEDISSEWAENGLRAVEMFEESEEGHFGAILMDMRMPVMDGVTATREIRKLPRPDAENIPIIALTANAFEEDVKQCLEAGMDAHMSKPVDIDLLKSLLGRMLAERK